MAKKRKSSKSSGGGGGSSGGSSSSSGGSSGGGIGGSSGGSSGGGFPDPDPPDAEKEKRQEESEPKPDDTSSGSAPATDPADSGDVARELDGATGDINTDGEPASDSSGDFLSPGVDLVEQGLSEVAQVASGRQSTRVQIAGDGSLLNQAAEADPDADIPASGEIFDGNRIVGGGEVEAFTEDFEQGVDEEIAQPLGDFAQGVASAPRPAAGPNSPVSVVNSVGRLVGSTEAVARGRPGAAPTTRPELAERRGEIAEGAVEEPVTAASSLPGLGIEVAEVGVEGAQSNPLLGADVEDTVEFGQQLGAAGSRAAFGTAAAAEQSPGLFAGQLLGGAFVGGAAETAVVRGLRASPDSGTPGARTSSSVDADSGAARVETDIGTDVTDGRVDVNVNRDITGEIDQLIGRARDAPRRAARRAKAAPQQVAGGVVDMGRRTRSGVRNTEVSVDANLQAGRAELGNLVNESVLGLRRARRDAPSPASVRQRAEIAGSQAADIVTDAGGTVRNRAVLAGRRARRDLGDIQPPTALVRNSDVDGFLGDTKTGRARPTDPAPDVIGTARKVAADSLDAASSRVRSAEVEADAGLQSLRDRVSGASDRAVLAGRRARRDVGDIQPPRALVRDSDGGGFLSDTSTGRARPGDAGAYVLDSAADRARSAADLASQLGVRVDVGKPTGRTVDASDLDIDDGATLDVDPGDLDDVDAGDDPVIFDVDEQATGDGTVTLRQSDVETDADTGTTTGTSSTDTSSDITGIGGAAGGVAGGVGDIDDTVGVGPGTGVDDTVGVGPGTGEDTGVGTDVGTGLDSGTRPDIRPKPKTGLAGGVKIDPGVGRDFDAGLGGGIDQRQRAEQEQAAVRSEAARKRLDVALSVDDDDRDDLIVGDATDEFTRTFEFGVASPGEILSGSGLD